MYIDIGAHFAPFVIIKDKLRVIFVKYFIYTCLITKSMTSNFIRTKFVLNRILYILNHMFYSKSSWKRINWFFLKYHEQKNFFMHTIQSNQMKVKLILISTTDRWLWINRWASAHWWSSVYRFAASKHIFFKQGGIVAILLFWTGCCAAKVWMMNRLWRALNCKKPICISTITQKHLGLHLFCFIR